ncbi:MAG: hypothetical protein QXW97_04635 [Candidatus Pacearchaeota archaeon]
MKLKIKECFIIGILLTLIFLPYVYAQEKNFDYIISNSEKWQDVYSSMLFASLNKVDSDFLVTTAHGNILLNSINKKFRIRVITSRTNPYVFNYPSTIRNRGFAEPSEIIVNNANTELINEMPNIDSFIVVGDSYGFNAIAVAPYAVLTNSWVFLGNKVNIYDIDEILSKRNIKKLIIYGYVDKEVRNTLAKYNPEIIDNQDRFKDNVQILKKYREINPVKQIAFSNGEFIEKELMNGREPVLFTGKENVPTEISNYLKSTDIEVGVLIGNDLVTAATNIKRSTGVNVMVKFARGARTETSGVSQVEGLDLFPIPSPYLKLTIHSIKYNKATNLLEVTYKSDSNAPAYLKGTFTINAGGERIRLGDIDALFIAPGDFKTILYSVNLTYTDSIIAEVYTLFGETPSSLDRVLTGTINVSVIEVLDRCKFSREDIKFVKYSKQKKAFIIRIKNPNPIDCYIDLELNDIIIGYTKKNVVTGIPILILSKKTKDITIKEELDDSDLEKNDYIKMTLYYGEREDILVNKLVIDKIKLGIETLSFLTYVIIILIVIIIILIIIIFLIKRKEKED